MVNFNIHDFSVYYSTGCTEDRLLYFDGGDVTHVEPLVLCGYYIYYLPSSSSNNVIFKFFSDKALSKRGFKISYKAVYINSTVVVVSDDNIGKYL